MATESPDPKTAREGTQSLPLVGRADALARVRTALSEAERAQPGVVMVSGPAGIGKTALLDAALAGDGPIVLRASGDADEVDLEYGVVEQLLRSVPRSLSDGAPSPPVPGAEPLRVGAEILQGLDRLELERRALVIAVDDVQWADQASLQALAFATRRLRADPVLVCLAGRPEGIEGLPPGLVRVAEATGGRVDLPGLDLAAVVELVRRQLGRPLAERAVRRLNEHTGGNPQHLRALLAELTYEELAAADPLPAPSSYSALVLKQLSGCTAQAGQLIEALAVLGDPAALSDLARMADLDDPLGPAEELAEHELVALERTPGGVRARFAHQLVRASVDASLAPTRRASLHELAAELTSGTESLRHRLAAGSGPAPQLVADAYAQAGALAREGRRRRGADLLLAAAPRADGPSERRDLVLAAAAHLVATGDAPGHVVDEVEAFPPSTERAHVLAWVAIKSGRFAEAERLLADAWERVAQGGGSTPLTGPIADLHAIVAEDAGDYEAVTTWARRALAAGSQSMSSATMLAFGLSMSESPRAAAAEMRGLLAGEPGPVLEVDARLGLAIADVYSNELETAEADLEAVLATPIAQASILVMVNARAYLAELCFRAGRWGQALDLAEATASIVDDAEQVWLSALPHEIAAAVLAFSGDLDRATEHASIARETAEIVRLVPARLWATHAELRVALAGADHERVAAIADAMAAEGWEVYPEWVHRWRAGAVESLVALDRIDDAERLTAQLRTEASDGTDLALAADTARASGVVAAAGGQAEEAQRAFAQGLDLDPAATRPLERARLELATGAHLRRAGQRRQASELLSAAAERLRTLGARPWLERCELELVACGLNPVKRSDPSAGSHLTPQERVVAGLVATGLTNREVAAELVLSEKTIEHHLSRIYRKLGVRSRTELAALVGGEAP